MNIFLKIIIYYSLVVIVFVFFVYLKIISCETKVPKIVNAVELKTGDIILISYDDMRICFSSMFYNSPWTHIGIVCVHGENTMIVEMSSYKYMKGPVHIIELEKWLRLNEKIKKKLSVMKINKELDSLKILDFCKKIKSLSVGLQSVDFTWFRFLKKKTSDNTEKYSLFASDKIKYNETELIKERNKTVSSKIKNLQVSVMKNLNMNKKYYSDSEEGFKYLITCSEFIIYMLQELEVISNHYTPCSYNLQEIADCKLPYIKGFEHKSPELFF